ncbi:MAG: phosphatase PAP2 family protein [Flavobacterium sp.]
MTKNYALIVTTIFTLFSFFAFAQNFDINTLRDINLKRDKSLDGTLIFVTNNASLVNLSTPLIIYSVGYINKDTDLKKKGIFLGETYLVNAFITIAMKSAINRDRPYVTYPDIDKQAEAGNSSFPSGHTSEAFCTATSLSIAFPKWYIIAPSFAWAGVVGYSRMDLGVHYPTDVIAGAIVGSGTAYLCYKLNHWINKKSNKSIFFEENKNNNLKKNK